MSRDRRVAKAEETLTEDVLEALYRWRAGGPNRTWRLLADISRVDHLTIKHIRDRDRVDGLTTAKLFVAIGEPVTRAQATAWKRWARAKEVGDLSPVVD